MATNQQVSTIQSMLVWLMRAAYDEMSLTLYEDHARGNLVDQALSAGWTLAIRKNNLLRDVSIVDGVLKDVQNISATPNSKHKPDIRITAPCPLVAELKVRGDFGTAVNQSVQAIRDDIDHVTSKRADVFFLVADEGRYDNLRTGGGAILFSNELPPRSSITYAIQTFSTFSEQVTGVSVPLIAACARVPSPFGERVVAALYTP